MKVVPTGIMLRFHCAEWPSILIPYLLCSRMENSIQPSKPKAHSNSSVKSSLISQDRIILTVSESCLLYVYVSYWTIFISITLFCSCLLICLSPKQGSCCIHITLSTKWHAIIIFFYLELNCIKQNLKIGVERILVLQCSVSLKVKQRFVFFQHHYMFCQLNYILIKTHLKPSSYCSLMVSYIID